jgi:hypothetical protein
VFQQTVLMLASKIVMCSRVRKNNNRRVIEYLYKQKQTKINRRSVLFEQLIIRFNLKYIRNSDFLKSTQLTEINQLTLEIDEINKRLDIIQ